jgi:protein gp37
VSDGSAIEWTDASWNPVRGCSRVSEGCRHCYAEGVAARFSKPGAPYEGLARFTPQGPRWTGKIRLVPELLEQPLRWRKPRRVFVNSMSDLFHEDVPDSFIDAVFLTMIAAPQHTFQILTKRAARMRRWFEARWSGVESVRIASPRKTPERPWPLPNVWLGVSVEDQAAADERIPELLAAPAAVRFLSCEPLLGPVDLDGLSVPRPGGEWRFSALRPDTDPGDDECFRGARVDWVIVGGESGFRARPLEVEWARSIVEQCRAAGVPAFVKQLGAAWASAEARGPAGFTDPKGGDPEEWPEDLRVREWPEVRP